MPNNLETYGLISGFWTSAFALGAFIGPSIAGLLFDKIGFRKASMFIIILHVIIVSTREKKIKNILEACNNIF